jgi:hypothetical protein
LRPTWQARSSGLLWTTTTPAKRCSPAQKKRTAPNNEKSFPGGKCEEVVT